MIKFLALFACITHPLILPGKTLENDGIMEIPLHRMESGLELLLRQGADLNLIKGFYEMARTKGTPKKQVLEDGTVVPSNTTLPLFKYFNTDYYGIVNIGKPGRPFKMFMDTAWSYSWVISEDCSRVSLACAVHSRYDHSRSSTYRPNGTPFNKSDLVGYLSSDVFLVGQLNATDQGFMEITHLPWIYALYGGDGTIGLGLKDLSPLVTPFFYNFLIQNRLKEPIFAFYVNRDPTTTRGGSVFFGGIDYKHNKTEFISIDVNSKYYWQFAVSKISVIISKKSKVDFCQNGCNALSDTSSNSIEGPAEEIKAINRLIGADRVLISGIYLIPCEQEHKGPKISFTINNKNFTIKAQNYIQKVSYSGFTMCLSAFRPTVSSVAPNTWVLGGAFFYQYYTAYDVARNKIMIAEVA